MKIKSQLLRLSVLVCLDLNDKVYFNFFYMILKYIIKKLFVLSYMLRGEDQNILLTLLVFSSPLKLFLCWCHTPLHLVRLCRLKKKAQAEANATSISNLLPFMEYEVHTQLMNKLKLRGMNALFGLRIQISVGENMLMGLAVSTVLILEFFCFLTVFFEDI